jgi:hypothetical protein
MIRIDRPPNFDAIVAVFPKAGERGVLFAYGEDIYNPGGGNIPRFLLEHEYKHCARQFLIGADEWWRQYLTDQEFRYQEELLAHAVEYVVQAPALRDRNAQARLLHTTAARLVAPLYAYDPPRNLWQAARDIRATSGL